MLNLSSLSQTLPMLLAGMVGIFLVIGVIILTVCALNRLTAGKEDSKP